MKKRDLERRMAKLAKEYAVEVTVKQGGNHEKWFAGSEAMPIPRHNEVKENTARGILRLWESILAEVAKRQAGQEQDQKQEEDK